MEEERALILSIEIEDEAKGAREEEKIKNDNDHQEIQQETLKQKLSHQKKFKAKEVQEFEEGPC